MPNSNISPIGITRSHVLQITRQRGQVAGLVIAGLLLVAVAVAASIGLSQQVDNPEAGISAADFASIPAYGFTFAQLILGATLITLVTSEWDSGAIIGSVATTQRRSLIVVSKVIVGTLFAMLVMTVAVAASTLSTNPLIPAEYRRTMDSSEDWTFLISIILAVALNTIMAIGIAFMFRRTALSIVVFVSIVVVAPLVLSIVPIDAIQTVNAAFPVNASNSIMSQSPPPEPYLEKSEGYIAMMCWALGSVFLGWLRMVKTDI